MGQTWATEKDPAQNDDENSFPISTVIVKNSPARIDPVEAAIGLPTATAERGAVARYL